ncbi:MAG: response regulator [Desulfobacterales bacterium]|nr:response regulator [Desulfobacterales bacterium]
MMPFDDKEIRLLLVDDEDGFRSAIAKRLKKRGFNPEEASDGEACLQILSQKRMDVIVLDVNMPGINGLDILARIKQSDENIQVILLTGNAAISDGVEGIKTGAFDYLTKPVEIDHLTNKIRQAFEIIHLEMENREELEYREKLEKKMIDAERLVSLGTMATGIAHEINNPLAIINEAAGFMKEVVNSPEMAENPKKASLELGIDKIEKSIKRARKITHQLLGYVKKEDFKFSRVDLKALLHETLGLLKKEINDKEIEILWEMEKGNNILWSDPYQIRQVLLNLLSNAVHALGKNGLITLSSKETPLDIVLVIQDNGAGIPKENLGRIFDPFFTTKSFDSGTGLGLYVVHKIIKNLEGEIDVESVPGKGTSFIIRLQKRVENNISQ